MTDTGEGPDERQDLVAQFRKRADRHTASARIDMAMIVVTLVVTAAAFIGADKVGDLVFSSPAERQARADLAEAEAELWMAVATLAEPAGDIIRALPEDIRPVLERWLTGYLSDLAGTDLRSGTEAETEAGVPPEAREGLPAPTIPDDPAAGLDDPVLLEPVPREPLRRAEPGDHAQPGPPEPAQRALASELYALLMEERRRNLDLIEELRAERAAALQERFSYDSDYQIASLRADAEIRVAEEQARAAIDVAAQETAQLAERNAALTTAMARIGSVVMAIWLTKIFVMKRQTSVRLSAFYTAAADALVLADRSDPRSLVDFLAVLMPRMPADPKMDQGEADMLARLLEALRGRV